MAHSGTSAAGAFVQTMVLTDIATGWTECVPVVMRELQKAGLIHEDCITASGRTIGEELERVTR